MTGVNYFESSAGIAGKPGHKQADFGTKDSEQTTLIDHVLSGTFSSRDAASQGLIQDGQRLWGEDLFTVTLEDLRDLTLQIDPGPVDFVNFVPGRNKIHLNDVSGSTIEVLSLATNNFGTAAADHGGEIRLDGGTGNAIRVLFDHPSDSDWSVWVGGEVKEVEIYFGQADDGAASKTIRFNAPVILGADVERVKLTYDAGVNMTADMFRLLLGVPNPNRSYDLTIGGKVYTTQAGFVSGPSLSGNADKLTIEGWIFGKGINMGGGNDTVVIDTTSAGYVPDDYEFNRDFYVYGRQGDDLYILKQFDRHTVVYEFADEGWDRVEAYGDYRLGAHVEELHLRGQAHSGTGNTQDNLIAGQWRANTLDGRDGDDTLIGRAGRDTLDGGAGDDLLLGGKGGDVLLGGEGVDTVSYKWAGQAVRMSLDGAKGAGAARGDTAAEVEVLVGSRFDDTLAGSVADDRLQGDHGDDTLRGFAGDDTMLGGAGADVLLGGDDADVLRGGAGDDVLEGHAGDDMLQGGLGSDLLSGGRGADSFVWKSLDESGPTQADAITDFTRGEDLLDITALMVTDLPGGAVPDAFTGQPGAIRFLETGGHTQLQIDANGDLGADFSVLILGVTGMDQSDLVPFG